MSEGFAAADVAILGLGNMGSALADAQLKSGRSVVVWNRTASRSDALIARGAVFVGSPAEAIRSAPVSIMCLNEYATTTTLLDSPDIADAIAGRTLVQLTSGLPEEAVDQSAWVQRHHGRFLAGGIMVFPSDIGQPEAQILYSGEANAYEEHRCLLEALGGGLQYLGENPGMSVAVYITAGLYMLGSLAVFLELAAVADTYGIPIEGFRDFALGTSRVLESRIRSSAARIAQRRFDGDEAAIDMVIPTLEQHCQHFERGGLQPRLTAAFVSHLKAASAEGRGHQDLAALVRPQGHARGQGS